MDDEIDDDLPPPDPLMPAYRIIDRFVQNERWGALWDALIPQLIAPLGLPEFLANDRKFASTVAEGFRAEWPESWTNRDLWLSRAGPWCQRHGMEKIIQIVRETANGF
jgi:hypothetical protein